MATFVDYLRGWFLLLLMFYLEGDLEAVRHARRELHTALGATPNGGADSIAQDNALSVW